MVAEILLDCLQETLLVSLLMYLMHVTHLYTVCMICVQSIVFIIPSFSRPQSLYLQLAVTYKHASEEIDWRSESCSAGPNRSARWGRPGTSGYGNCRQEKKKFRETKGTVGVPMLPYMFTYVAVSLAEQA